MPTTLRGQFLLAASTLADDNFYRAVVLMLRHDDEGAMGVIVNRPLEIRVSEAVAGAVPAATGVDQPLFQGGPCPGPMMLLHDEAGVAGDEIVPGVRYTDQRDAIERVMSRGDASRSRYILGYAGWAADQLEGELGEGSWLLTPATAELFGEPDDLWQTLATRATLGRFIRPTDFPSDPNLN